MSDSAAPNGGIAIIGMACRFPGARTPEAFWDNLAGGVESIEHFSREDLREAGVFEETLRSDAYVPACGALEDVTAFDASFFGLSPREATAMDPQQRLFLETAWQAMERAGYDPLRTDAPIGLYAGVGWNHYLLRHLAAAGPSDFGDLLQHRIRNDKDFLTTTTSYKLDLQGPSLAVQTACSTSLVATHLACQSLRDYECDAALVGGVNVNVPSRHGYSSRDSVFSPDGHCRAFDADANGTVPGSGVGIVVLKRLRDALDDGDQVHAVIRGTAVNNDGNLKAGYTAPSVEGQAEVIATAQALAEFDPSTVTYVEAHGTGTPMGDPIEVEALTQAFRMGTDRTQFCGLGSVKTNVGHLDAAAGVASLIKTALALEHEQIPPSLHFRRPNPRIDFANSPFYVADTLTPWETNGHPRRAGVSAFGVGGTNAHVAVEEAPERAASRPSRPRQLLVVSAPSKAALETQTDNLADHLDDQVDHETAADPDVPLGDVSYTLWTGRRRFSHRRAVVADDRAGAIEALRDRSPDRTVTVEDIEEDRPVAFLYPGLGNQHENMGRELYRTEPVFRETFDRCEEALEPYLETSILDVLYPHGPWKQDDEPPEDSQVDFRALVKGRNGTAGEDSPVHQTKFAQPIQFAVEYALAELWASWGVDPYAAIGHSIGEYVAACRAGVFSLKDALRLVATRANAIADLPSGSMMAVSLPEEEVETLLDDDVFVSALNTPSMTTVAGPDDAVDALHRRLEHEDVTVRRTQTAHAFHTPHMRPAADAVADAARQIDLRPPSGSFVSNLSGTWIRDDQATDPEYWARHMCQPVRFYEGIETLMRRNHPALLEVGPGQTLGAWARQNPSVAGEDPLHIAASLPHESDPQSEQAFILRNLGKLWAAGAVRDSAGIFDGQDRRRTSLPTTPFERSHFDISATLSRGDGAPAAPAPATGRDPEDESESAPRRRPSAERFETPVWEQVANRPASTRPSLGAGNRRWLVLAPSNPSPVLQNAIDALRAAGARGLLVREGRAFDAGERPDAAASSTSIAASEVGTPGLTCRARSAEDFEALVDHLQDTGTLPTHVLYGWMSRDASPDDGSTSDLDSDLDRSFFGLLHLIQALGGAGGDDSISLTALTHGAHQVLGTDTVSPAHSALMGPCRVAGQEYDRLDTQLLDVGSSPDEPISAEALLTDCITLDGAPLLAYRARRRWARSTQSVPLHDASAETGLRDEGVYLIAGGLGAVGRTLARSIAAAVDAPRLVLTGRRDLPSSNASSAEETDDETARRLQHLRALEEEGAEVVYRRADVTNRDRMIDVVEEVCSRYGHLDGAVHAAGVAPGGLIQVKDTEEAAQVLAPKVTGTRVLFEALQQTVDPASMDFIMLSSSLHALAGGVGTVDHTAANAFQDAFAAHARAATDAPITSVNWAGWSDIGQAARADYSDRLRSAVGDPDAGPSGEETAERSAEEIVEEPEVDGAGAEDGESPPAHPLLTGRMGEASAPQYRVRITTDEHWVADGHRLDGTAVLPGTASLDLMVAALSDYTGQSAVALDDVRFLTPLVVPDGDGVAARLDVRDGGERLSLHTPSADDPHVTARADSLSTRPSPQDLDVLRERCDRQTITIGDPEADAALSLGPRWRQISTRLHLGDGEAFSELTLGEAHRDDTQAYGLHPALLDTATGLLQALHDEDVFLPISYGRFAAYASLPARIYSHLTVTRAGDADNASADVLTCDVTLFDDDGAVLVEIEDYTMRRVSNPGRHVDTSDASGASPETPSPSADTPAAEAASPEEATPETASASQSQTEAMTLSPDEGADAFHRILAAGTGRDGIGPQVAVSPVPVAAFVREVDALHTDDIVDRIGRADPHRHDRPDLGTEFVSPRSNLEDEVAEIWSSTLGIGRIGVHDNFFELGGDSLLATRLIELLGDEFRVDPSLRMVFDAPTVAEMAESIVAMQATRVDDDQLDTLLDEIDDGS
jgi:acyl transferase domain-containing protein/acyl carrier protein